MVLALTNIADSTSPRLLSAPSDGEESEQIARELIAVYRPGCNPDQYDQSWKDEWIGEYQTPTTGPLTTGRDPSAGRQG